MTKRSKAQVVNSRWERKSEKGNSQFSGVTRAEKREKAREKVGNMQLSQDNKAKHEEYKLDWFSPTPKQTLITDSMKFNALTALQGSSGTGKSTTVIWQGLQDLKKGLYQKIIFVKPATETCDDKIGFLSGSADEKLLVHFDSMRTIFQDFMSKEKLAMEEKRGHIEFTIPNFITGRTLSNTLIILDEAHLNSPSITKLLMERAGEGSRIIIMGDKMQTYAKDKRADGFSDFVYKITEVVEGVRTSTVDGFGYIELGAGDNMRSDLSRAIVSIYEGADDW